MFRTKDPVIEVEAINPASIRTKTKLTASSVNSIDTTWHKGRTPTPTKIKTHLGRGIRIRILMRQCRTVPKALMKSVTKAQMQKQMPTPKFLVTTTMVMRIMALTCKMFLAET